MRSYGMNLQDLGLLVGLLIGSVLLLGFLGMAVKIPRLVYLPPLWQPMA